MTFIDSGSCFKRGLKQNADAPPGRKCIPAYSSLIILLIQLISSSKLVISYLTKNYLMDKDITPNGEPVTISFAGKMLTVNEPEPGKVITI